MVPPTAPTRAPRSGRWAPKANELPKELKGAPNVDAMLDKQLQELAGPMLLFTLQGGYVNRKFSSVALHHGGSLRLGLKLWTNKKKRNGMLIATVGTDVYGDRLVEVPVSMKLRWYMGWMYGGFGGGWILWGGKGPGDPHRTQWVAHPLAQAQIGINWPQLVDLGAEAGWEFRRSGEGGVMHIRFYVGVEI